MLHRLSYFFEAFSYIFHNKGHQNWAKPDEMKLLLDRKKFKWKRYF